MQHGATPIASVACAAFVLVLAACADRQALRPGHGMPDHRAQHGAATDSEPTDGLSRQGAAQGSTTEPDAKVPTPVLASPEVPVIAVYSRRKGWIPPILDIAVSASGLLVWREAHHDSANSVLLQANIDASLVADLLQELEKAGVFREPHFGWVYGTPDGPETHIDIATETASLRMVSWHEMVEQDAMTVVTDRGARALATGESRADALRSCSEEYQRYRGVWSKIRSALQDWVPKRGEPYAGGLQFRNGARLLRQPVQKNARPELGSTLDEGL